MDEVAIIGGGPAGLRVAELLSAAGFKTHLFEQKRSVGRKFLIAGKSGLNLTSDAEREGFLGQYKGGDCFPRMLLNEIYDSFSNEALRVWAQSHGQETFVSSGQKVFPKSMKAAPLLRAWVKKIREQGVHIHVNHAWNSLVQVGSKYNVIFQSPEGEVSVQVDKVIFALGGGSWSQTGSDGGWVSPFRELGISVNTLQAANSGWEVSWDEEFRALYEGTPWKNILCKAGQEEMCGELVVTKYGLEGGPIYRLGHALRQSPSPELEIDFKPSMNESALMKKLESVRRNLPSELRQRCKLPESVISLLQLRNAGLFSKEKLSEEDLQNVVKQIKSCKIPLERSRPLDEAISSAGGLAWSELDSSLMLKKFSNVYACGEMLDWEAPTGGFLLQGCFSTANWVAQRIVERPL